MQRQRHDLHRLRLLWMIRFPWMKSVCLCRGQRQRPGRVALSASARRAGRPRRPFQKGAHQSGCRRSRSTHRRSGCCRDRAAAASRHDEHKGKLQHIHDRNNHNMQGCDSPIVAGLRLATCGRVATRQLWQGCDSSLVAGLRLAILSYLEPNTQTNEPTNMQTTNQSIKRTN